MLTTVRVFEGFDDDAGRHAPTPPMACRYHTSGNERLDALRATALAELRPHAQRLMVKPITIRQAIVASISPFQERTTYRTDRRIEVDTADGHRKNLCGLFGLSSSEDMEVVRETGVDVELRLHEFDQKKALVLAQYWHRMPEGVESTRTVRNDFQAGRKFFRFCNDHAEYGWKTPPGILEEYTASKVDTPAVPYDAAQTKKILAQGGNRLKMFCLPHFIVPSCAESRATFR